ncbi:MAG: methyltransferase [Ahrensia sp.]|nr:methyltransferase [Ahrensia sp.]
MAKFNTDTQTTIDHFHRGQFVLVQPASGGHRSGIDAMLLAACVADGFSGHLADLGAGAGAAGLAALNRCRQAQASLFEASDVVLDCARQTLNHPENAHLANRTLVFKADITANGQTRQEQGLIANAFDWVIANPPFNNPEDRRSPNHDRSFAHVMDGETIELWTRTAASICKPSGHFSIIVRPQSIGEIIAAFQGRFGRLRMTPVHARAGEDAIRLLVTGKKGSKQRLEIGAPLILHQKDGREFTEKADALINGVIGLM